MPEIKNLENLLQQTKIILHHQNEKEKLKGEKFNIFSVLKMETKENDTHSNFLAELLNPDGSHLKEHTFLKLFLNTIDHKSIDLNTVRVKTEKYIGVRNDELKTGGRIDIYIEDNSGNCLCIENKINADDQLSQIERYTNYRKGSNSVYYLNLHGTQPSNKSKGELEADKHFHIISYKVHIINWLSLCLKEVAEEPILRETIRQYIILIKKITFTMDIKENSQLTALMFKHYNEATYIAGNFETEKYKIRAFVWEGVVAGLKEKVTSDFNIYSGKSPGHLFSQIWIKLKDRDNAPVFIGIESFSGRFESDMFIGIFKEKGKVEEFYKTDGVKSKTEYWFNVEAFKPYQGFQVNLNKAETLSRLYEDDSFKNGFINHMVSESVIYINNQKKFLEPEKKD